MVPTFNVTIQQYLPLLNTKPKATVRAYLRGPIRVCSSHYYVLSSWNNHALIQGESYNDSFRQHKCANTVEEHRSLGGSIIRRLDNGAFVGLIYELLVSLSSTWK